MRQQRRFPRPPRVGWRGRGTSLAARLLTFLAICLIALVALDLRIRPAVEDMVAYQAQLYALQILNTSMMRELEENGTLYTDIARVNRSENGKVSSIQTDVVAVNRLKTRVAESAMRELSQLDTQTIELPAGSLFGHQLISGIGPTVSIRIVPSGYIETDLYNEFVSAGINQTLHRVMLRTGAQLVAILPGYSVKTKIDSSFCVAETVIVGEIPEGYTIVDGDSRSDISKVYDYGKTR